MPISTLPWVMAPFRTNRPGNSTVAPMILPSCSIVITWVGWPACACGVSNNQSQAWRLRSTAAGGNVVAMRARN